MATSKEKTIWFCSSCGNESPKWMGRCPACGEWNTMVEKSVVTGKTAAVRVQSVVGGSSRPLKLSEIASAQESRATLGIAELDRLLGGGLVEGSLVLIGG